MVKTLKQYCRLAVFLIFLFFVMRATKQVFCYKAPYGIPQFESFYLQERNTVDVLFAGSSHVYSDINPAVLWEQKGISSFNLSTGGAGIWNSYYAIREALKTQRPRVVVLEIFRVLADGEFRQPREQMDANFAFSLSSDYMAQLKASTPKEQWADMFLEFPYYHIRYQDIKKSDFLQFQNIYEYEGTQFWLYPENNKKAFKGEVSLFVTTPFETFPDVSGVDGEERISEKNEFYLRRLIDELQTEDIPLVFLISPYAGVKESDQRRFNYVKRIAEENEIPVWDFNMEFERIGLDPLQDFAEDSHLNYKGMESYSRYLAECLSGKYQLLDRRGDPRYSSWDDSLDWKNHIYALQALREETELRSYLKRIENLPSCIVAASLEGPPCPAQLADELRDARLLDTDHQRVCVSQNGDILYEANGRGESFWHREMGASDLAVFGELDGAGNIVYRGVFDRKDCRRAEQGINLAVFDEYTGQLIDIVGFDAERDWQARR